MKKFLGIFFDFTQGPKKGGIVCVFDVSSDGLFPTLIPEKIGLKHWGSKELFYYWKYATLDDGDNEDQADPFW